MTMAVGQRGWLTDSATEYCAATVGIGDREAERTSRHTTVRSVTRIWRSATRSGDAYRSRATKTQDGIMTLTGTQRWGLADRAAHYCAATIGIGYREAERTSRRTRVRSVTRIRRGATRSGDVYRGSATETQDRIMTLTGAQRVRLSQRNGRARRAAIGIRHRVSVRTHPLREAACPCVRHITTRGTDSHRSCPAMTGDRAMRVADHQGVSLANWHARGRAGATVRIGNAGRIGSRSQTGVGCAAGHSGVGNAIDCDRVRRRTAADCDGNTAIITAVATCRGGRFRGRDRCWNSDGHRSAYLLATT